jgi:hypothetical protein
MKKIKTLIITLISVITAGYAQHANVIVNATSTTNGSWSGGTAGPYVFTPSANAATVLNSDIVSRLVGTNGFTKGNVTIETTCGSCSDAGNISVNNVITAASSGTLAPTLTFNAQNNISITQNLTLTGANGAGFGGAGGNGSNLSLTTLSGDIALSNNAIVITSGGAGAFGGGNGGNAGTITMNAAGSFALNTGSNMTSNGGAAGAGGGAAGNANNMSLTGGNGIRLAGNLTATGTTRGNFTINDGNSTVTTGGGVNDGQTAGVISGGNLTKLGSGTFYIAGTNTYNGTTTITAGTLRPTTTNVTPSANGPFGNNASGILLNGGAIESNVTTFSRPITVSASDSRIDAFGANRAVSATITLATAGTYTLNIGGTTAASAAGQELTLTGVISNSAGTLNLHKVGTSSVLLNAANTFTGGVNLKAGTLNINNANALGNVAGTFTIDSGTTINATTGAITTVNHPIVVNGDFSYTGTQTLNLGTGAVTLNDDVQITTVASTLTIGGIINNATRSITKAGAGILNFTNQAITLNSLTVSTGTLTASSGTTSLVGNFINNATFANNNGTVILNGTSTQTITGTAATTFRNLTINNSSPASPQVVLEANATVSNTLTLTQGNVDAVTNAKALIVSNNATGAIVRTGGYVIGDLQRAITNTGSPTYSYYLGTQAGSYTPVNIIFNTLTAGGILTGSAVGADQPNVCTSTINVGMTVNDYWTFASTGITYTNYGASFTYPSGDLDNGVTAGSFIAGKYTTGAWSYPTLNGTPTATNTAISGATSFGTFAIGNTTTNGITYLTNEACDNISTALTPSITGALDGVFSSTAGLSIDSVSGNITPNTSTPGVYIVSYSFPDAVCVVPVATATVTIKAAPTASITNVTGTTVVDCNNPLISVTATGGDAYTWSGGSSISTAANTFSLSGVYSVTVATSNGCSDFDTITITVDTIAPVINITNHSGGSTLTCVRSQISVTASGGGVYLWSGGDSTNTAGNTFDTTGSYILTVTGSNGCASTDSVVVTYDTIAPTAGITNNTGTTVITCANPLISVTATGGATYAWSGGDSTNTPDNTFPVEGSYTVTVTGANGCISYDSITLTIDTVIASITNNGGFTVIDCNNNSVNVTAAGGAPYVWSGGSTPNTANNTFTSAGTYTVTVTNNNGCDDQATITITEDITPPTVNIVNNSGGSTLTCDRSQISVTATGAASYSWSGGDSTITAGNTFDAIGSYTVTATGVNGCVNTNTVEITYDTIAPMAGITNNTGVTIITCTNPSVSVTATGGATYSWSGGNSTNTASNTLASAGSYTVTVIGANGCIAYDSIALTIDTVAAGIINNTGATMIDCNNSSIDVTATGGAPYTWSGGSDPNNSFNSLTSGGTYTVTVTNNNGCNDQAVITITQDTSPPTVFITNNTGITELTCDSTLIQVTASGGISYSWSGGDSVSTAVNTFTAPGNYIVNVTGSNGCTNSDNITITQNITPPTLGITNLSGTSLITCAVTTISVTATGADSYTWSGGDSLNTAGNTFSGQGTYTVTGSSAINGCVNSDVFVVSIDTTKAEIINNSGTVLLDCNNTVISLTATGGSSYSWTGGSSMNTDVNTFDTPGTYSVTVVNTNGCNNIAELTITQDIATPTVQITNTTGTNVLNCSIGVIAVTATGGTSYAWSGGDSISNANNTFTLPGNYTVTVSGNNGCVSSESISISQNEVKPNIVVINNGVTGATVINCLDESVTYALGGADTYSWSGGNSPNSNVNIFSSPGTYTVIGTNANFCQDTLVINVTENKTAPNVGITNNSGTNVLNCNVTSINVTATGADGYVWSDGNSTTTAANTFLNPGMYNVIGTNSTNYCTDTAYVTIALDNAPPTVSITNNPATTVLNCSITSISLEATGASTYVWSAGSSTNSAANLITTPNSYTVTGTDASNGCSTQASITITQDITLPTVGITNNTGVTVLDCDHPAINVTATGAASYVWSGGTSTSNSANTLSAAGSYTVTGTANNGCTNSTTITLTEDVVLPTIVITNNTGLTELTCTTTLIKTTASGADVYSWTGGSSPASAINSFTTPGTYTVTGTNSSNGCGSSAIVTLTQDVTPPAISITNNTGVTLLTNEYPFVDVTATGIGTGYSWSGGIFPSTAHNVLDSAGTYTVTTVGTNGCSNSASIQIKKATVNIALTGGANPSCAGDVPVYEFTANTDNVGGNPTYQWKVNGNNVGTNSSVYTSPSLSNGDVVKAIITVQSTTLTATSNQFTIIINPLPEQPTITQNGNTLMSSSTMNNQWFLNGAEIPGATAQFYTFTEKGFYSVSVSNGVCMNTSPILTDIENVISENTLAVYPNPFATETKLSFGKYVNDVLVKVISVRGETIKESTVSGTETIIAKDGLSAGVYFIQVIGDGISATQKVIVY